MNALASTRNIPYTIVLHQKKSCMVLPLKMLSTP